MRSIAASEGSVGCPVVKSVLAHMHTGGVIREVEMEEDSEAESFGEREVVRKQHRKARDQNDGGETERAVMVSRWELMDDGEADQQRISTRKCQSNVSSQLGEGKDGSKEPEACDLREAIKRAQQKKVRWADEEEEIEGFHIGGNKYEVLRRKTAGCILLCGLYMLVHDLLFW